jgi:hypothetical protein
MNVLVGGVAFEAVRLQHGAEGVGSPLMRSSKMLPAGPFSSPILPEVAMRPLSSTIRCSQVYSTSGSRCDDRIRLTPLLCPRSRISSSISSRPFGSIPLVGSSRNSRSGSWTSACASLMRCFMPVE